MKLSLIYIVVAAGLWSCLSSYLYKPIEGRIYYPIDEIKEGAYLDKAIEVSTEGYFNRMILQAQRIFVGYNWSIIADTNGQIYFGFEYPTKNGLIVDSLFSCPKLKLESEFPLYNTQPFYKVRITLYNKIPVNSAACQIQGENCDGQIFMKDSIIHLKGVCPCPVGEIQAKFDVFDLSLIEYNIDK